MYTKTVSILTAVILSFTVMVNDSYALQGYEEDDVLATYETIEEQEENEPDSDQEVEEEIVIHSFKELTAGIKKKYYVGTYKSKLKLPKSLTGLYYDELGEPQEIIIDDVQWTGNYNRKKAGKYVFVAEFSLPEGYYLQDDNDVTVTIELVLKRIYQTPGRYFKVKDKIPVRKSGYKLRIGMSGLKVYYVQKKLKCYYGHAKYTSTTAYKVKSFQRRKGLKATGVVDKKTWLKMGYRERGWYYTDSYVIPLKVKKNSKKNAHINAMVKTARQYLGTKYIWCAAGRPGQGVDCAGLVLQCMYSAGIDPLPSGSHVYAYPKNEYTTRRLWNNKKLKHVSYSSKRKGDIIVYHNGAGTVNHVTLYIGGGKEIESLPVVGTVVTSVGGYVKGVLRPII